MSDLSKSDEVLQAERQEMFNLVVQTLMVKQHGRRAVDGKGSCRYRASNGDKCAFGVLIPDDLYSPTMEGKGSREVLQRIDTDLDEDGHFTEEDVKRSEALRAKFAGHFTFISELQNAHDCARDNDPEHLAYMLRQFGHQYRLEVPEIID